MDPTKDEVSESRELDLSGRQLGDFQLLRRLGQGAMAEVYLAEQISLKRPIAVKILKSNLAADETYVRRFQREAQAAASLVHANIVQIHEVGQIGQSHYIVQEYVQGLNLRQWLARNGSPDLRLALLVMRQVTAALAKAAEQGIVHRDIKPENIMLTRNGEVKVADFGLARLLHDGRGLELTEVGITLGTPLYMSPEQVEGRPLDPRSDIYSFGVTCYQMLAGSPPFSGETALSVAVQHLKKQPEPLENHRPDLPAPLCRAVHKMLAKSPDARFQSPQELLRELRRIQQAHLDEQWPEDAPALDLPMAATTSISLNEATQRLDAVMKTSAQSVVRVRPRWLWWTIAVAAAFLVGGGFAFFVAREPPLLTTADARPPVPRQETVFRQWIYASTVGTPDAWQSVIDYFPDKHYWVYRAKQQLARIYLREGDLDQAMEMFQYLASLDAAEAELKAYGLAGTCAVLTMEGKYQESADAMNQFWPLHEKLRDPAMGQLLQHIVKTNRSKLGGEFTKQDWEKWLKEQFPPPVDSP
jgi:eukaryotic-like serine/threonine-protein kinase